MDLERAFPELVRTHQGLVYSITLRLSGGHSDEAEDAAQDAFVAAFRSLQNFDDERWAALQARPWLAAIAVNVCRNRARAASRRPALTRDERGDVTATRKATGASVADEVAARETASELAGALRRLSSPQRHAVVLHHGAGLTYAEVATAVGRAEGTVKADVHRGLVALRSLLDPQELLA